MSLQARLVKRLPPTAEQDAFELDVELKAEPGITVLFGASGSGKTLTLNCLSGFARPDSGRILVDGQLYFDSEKRIHLAPQRRHCGYIFQDHALFPHKTVRDNLRFAASSARGARTRGLNRHRRINELLQSFELTELAERKPAQLSGGQKQRAAIARALVGDPRVLLLDEPARGLDERLRQSFYDVLRTTSERLRIPLVLVTHDLQECFALADTVCLIDRGRFVQTGPAETVFARPATAEIARSLGTYNVMAAEITALDPQRNTSTLSVAGHKIEAAYLPGRLIGDRGFLCVREAEMAVLPLKTLPISNGMELAVTGCHPSADGVRLQFEQGITAMVSAREYESLRGSDRLRVEIPASQVYFIPAT